MKCLIKNKNWDIVEDYNLDKLLYLLIDRPDIIGIDNVFVWLSRYNKNCSTRNYNLPSFISSHYDIMWDDTGRQIMNI